jgi:hypothetical protein
MSCVQLLQDPTAFPVPTFQDLAGFWDLLQLSIEDVTLKFLELQQLKANSWKLLEPKVCVCVCVCVCVHPSGQGATIWKMPFTERGMGREGAYRRRDLCGQQRALVTW